MFRIGIGFICLLLLLYSIEVIRVKSLRIDELRFLFARIIAAENMYTKYIGTIRFILLSVIFINNFISKVNVYLFPRVYTFIFVSLCVFFLYTHNVFNIYTYIFKYMQFIRFFHDLIELIRFSVGEKS